MQSGPLTFKIMGNLGLDLILFIYSGVHLTWRHFGGDAGAACAD